jgi:hypothetical protein
MQAHSKQISHWKCGTHNPRRSRETQFCYTLYAHRLFFAYAKQFGTHHYSTRLAPSDL